MLSFATALLQIRNHSIQVYTKFEQIKHTVLVVKGQERTRQTYLLRCLVLMEDVIVSKAETFGVPELRIRYLFVFNSNLLDLSFDFLRHLTLDHLVAWHPLRLLHLVNQLLECGFEARRGLISLCNIDNTLSVLDCLFSNRRIFFQELEAGRCRTRQYTQGFAGLVGANEKHRRGQRVQNVHLDKILQELIKAVLLLGRP